MFRPHRNIRRVREEDEQEHSSSPQVDLGPGNFLRGGAGLGGVAALDRGAHLVPERRPVDWIPGNNALAERGDGEQRQPRRTLRDRAAGVLGGAGEVAVAAGEAGVAEEEGRLRRHAGGLMGPPMQAVGEQQLPDELQLTEAIDVEGTTNASNAATSAAQHTAVPCVAQLTLQTAQNGFDKVDVLPSSASAGPAVDRRTTTTGGKKTTAAAATASAPPRPLPTQHAVVPGTGPGTMHLLDDEISIEEEEEENAGFLFHQPIIRHVEDLENEFLARQRARVIARAEEMRRRGAGEINAFLPPPRRAAGGGNEEIRGGGLFGRGGGLGLAGAGLGLDGWAGAGGGGRGGLFAAFVPPLVGGQAQAAAAPPAGNAHGAGGPAIPPGGAGANPAPREGGLGLLTTTQTEIIAWNGGAALHADQHANREDPAINNIFTNWHGGTATGASDHPDGRPVGQFQVDFPLPVGVSARVLSTSPDAVVPMGPRSPHDDEEVDHFSAQSGAGRVSVTSAASAVADVASEAPSVGSQEFLEAGDGSGTTNHERQREETPVTLEAFVADSRELCRGGVNAAAGIDGAAGGLSAVPQTGLRDGAGPSSNARASKGPSEASEKTGTRQASSGTRQRHAPLARNRGNATSSKTDTTAPTSTAGTQQSSVETSNPPGAARRDPPRTLPEEERLEDQPAVQSGMRNSVGGVAAAAADGGRSPPQPNLATPAVDGGRLGGLFAAAAVRGGNPAGVGAGERVWANAMGGAADIGLNPGGLPPGGRSDFVARSYVGGRMRRPDNSSLIDHHVVLRQVGAGNCSCIMVSINIPG